MQRFICDCSKLHIKIAFLFYQLVMFLYLIYCVIFLVIEEFSSCDIIIHTVINYNNIHLPSYSSNLDKQNSTDNRGLGKIKHIQCQSSIIHNFVEGVKLLKRVTKSRSIAVLSACMFLSRPDSSVCFRASSNHRCGRCMRSEDQQQL